MKLTKKIFALLALRLCLGGKDCLPANSSSGKSTAKARTIEEIKKSGELRTPSLRTRNLRYVDNMGAYQGYDIELGNRLAKDLGVKPKCRLSRCGQPQNSLISNMQILRLPTSQ